MPATIPTAGHLQARLQAAEDEQKGVGLRLSPQLFVGFERVKEMAQYIPFEGKDKAPCQY